jgi:hypothetical protein
MMLLKSDKFSNEHVPPPKEITENIHPSMPLPSRHHLMLILSYQLSWVEKEEMKLHRITQSNEPLTS